MKTLKNKQDLDFWESRKKKLIESEEKRMKSMSMRDTSQRKLMSTKNGRNWKD